MFYHDHYDTLRHAVDEYRNGNRADAIDRLKAAGMARPLHFLKQYLLDVEAIGRDEANRQVLEIALIWEMIDA